MSIFNQMMADCPLCKQPHDDGGIYIYEKKNGTRGSMFFCLDCDELRRKEVAEYVLTHAYKPICPDTKHLEEVINED